MFLSDINKRGRREKKIKSVLNPPLLLDFRLFMSHEFGSTEYFDYRLVKMSCT